MPKEYSEADEKNAGRQVKPMTVRALFILLLGICAFAERSVAEPNPAVEPEDCFPPNVRASLAQHTNVMSCFDRNPALPQRSGPQMPLFERDLRVCNCLRTDMPEMVRGVMTPRGPAASGERDLIRDNIARQGQNARLRIENNQYMMLFQAGIIDRGQSMSRFLAQSGFGAVREQTIQELVPSVQAGVRSVTPTALGATDRRDRAGDSAAVQDSVQRALPSFQLPTEPPPQPYQCVMGSDFIAFQQLPTPQVRAELARGNFEPDNWDYRKLMESYHQIIRDGTVAGQRERFVAIKAQIRFLNRNPLVRHVMAATPANLEGMLTRLNLPAEDQRQIRAIFNDTEKLNQFKLRLFETLRSSVGSASCQPGDQACATRALRSGQAQRFQAGLRRFFSDNREALQVAKAENDKNHFEQLEALRTRQNTEIHRATDSYQGVMARFLAQSSGLRSPESCGATNRDIVSCVESFSAYCHYLDREMPRIRASATEDPETLDDIETDDVNLFNLDIRRNADLQRFNDAICNTPRVRRSGARNDRPMTFFDFRRDYCSRNASSEDCSPGNANGLRDLRRRFLSDHSEPARPSTSTLPSDEVQAFNDSSSETDGLGTLAITRKVALSSERDRSTSTYALSDKQWSNISGGLQNEGLTPKPEGFVAAGGGTKENFTPPSTGGGTGLTGPSSTVAVPGPVDGGGSLGGSFSAALPTGLSTPAISGTRAEPGLIENMSTEARRELLQGMQRDYEEFRQTNANSTDPQVVAREEQMRTEISSLRTLLTQQQQITRDQARLLNDAISRRRSAGPESSTAALPEGTTRRPVPANEGGSGEGPVQAGASESGGARAPASVRDAQLSQGAVRAGTSRRTQREAPEASNDSVARETAKLVNLRRNTDGTITIEAAPSAAGQGAANAISVPVTDEQYRILQTNPQGLSLGQLERSIPREQLDRLGQQGEVVIILRNGSNPPFEVKVERRDNRLVYSVRDSSGRTQAPVRRIHTRAALESELRTPR